MSPKNETCDAINAYVMQLIPGDAGTFVSADSVEDSQAAMYPTEFLNSLSPNGMPPHQLILKRYASIILLRSLDPTQGLSNGTRLIIRSVTRRLIDAVVATGSHVGDRVFIPRIPLLTPTDSGFPFILKRTQFPIRPAFCITINKGQGQSLDTVGIFLPSPEAIFGHGQLYVALSRGLKIMVCAGSEYAGGGVLVKNVVYREVFLTPVEKPLSSYSDLISSFSQVAPILSSHCIHVFTPVKRGSIGDYFERESKVSKIFEFSLSDVIALEDPRECVLLSNDISFGFPDNLFSEVIRFPRDMTEHWGITSVTNFTFAMRLNLVQSIGLGTEEILPNRKDLFIRGTYFRFIIHHSPQNCLINLELTFIYVQFMVMVTVYTELRSVTLL